MWNNCKPIPSSKGSVTFASIYLLALSNVYESPFALTGAIIRVMDISEVSFEQLAEERRMRVWRWQFSEGSGDLLGCCNRRVNVRARA